MLFDAHAAKKKRNAETENSQTIKILGCRTPLGLKLLCLKNKLTINLEPQQRHVLKNMFALFLMPVFGMMVLHYCCDSFQLLAWSYFLLSFCTMYVHAVVWHN